MKWPGCAILLFLLAACGGADTPDPGTPEVYVSAAASTTDAVSALAELYGEDHHVRVRLNFAASSLLARQVDDGAPAGVYISASREWVDFLVDKGLVHGEPAAIAGNSLVCVTRRGADFGPASLDELADSDVEVAIADQGVPAGEYARSALLEAGLLERFDERLIAQRDVRAAVTAVIGGHARAAIVYASDAAAFPEELEVAFAIDASLHEPIRYYAARVKRAESPKHAADFFEFLKGDRARAKLKELGFTEP